MVLESLRPTTSGGRHPALCLSWLTMTSEVQGECRAELARAMLSRSLHSYSQLLVCEYKGTTFFVRFQISGIDLMAVCHRSCSNSAELMQASFCSHQIATLRAIFSTNLTNWCFQHRRCSRSAELMQAWLCTRLIASFKRTVILCPRIRNFWASCITFRRWQQGGRFLSILGWQMTNDSYWKIGVLRD